MNLLIKEQDYVIAEHEFGEMSISSNPEKGFRPFQVLISGICGCAGMTFRKILEKQRLDFNKIEIVPKATRVKEEANRISELNLHFIVEGTDLKSYKIEKNLELTEKNCGMIQSVKDSIKISFSFELI